MTDVDYHVVDAFSSTPFSGNPAAVVPLSRAAPEAWMQRVATEMNLSETAFTWPAGTRGWRLRWFTPTAEVPLCGHATLATAHILWERGPAPAGKPLRFLTRSGPLHARREGTRVVLDLPAKPPRPRRPPAGLARALAVPIRSCAASSDDLYAELDDERAVRAARPDLHALARHHPLGVVVHAPGRTADYVCRYFAPGYGIPEDPGTGSIQCALAPLWAARLGKDQLTVRQLSRRGATMVVRPAGRRVEVGGDAVTVATGRLHAAPAGVV